MARRSGIREGERVCFVNRDVRRDYEAVLDASAGEPLRVVEARARGLIVRERFGVMFKVRRKDVRRCRS